ncbi:exported hypothetical protein [Candidatus Sulfopaludibacter sp. SbA4]|nr:exported hypothetical protein [Candidatus Sulfopaludibacter sp. SbA4]
MHVTPKDGRVKALWPPPLAVTMPFGQPRSVGAASVPFIALPWGSLERKSQSRKPTPSCLPEDVPHYGLTCIEAEDYANALRPAKAYDLSDVATPFGRQG